MYFAISVLFLFNVEISFSHEYNPTGWDLATEYVLEYLNPTIDPCTDFYQFACGGQNKTAEESLKPVNYVKEFLNDALPQINVTSPQYAQWLQTFFQKCMESNYTDPDLLLEDINVNLKKHFLPAVADVQDGLVNNDEDSFWKFLGYLQKEQNMPFLIHATVVPSEILIPAYPQNKCAKKPMLHVNPFAFLENMNVTYFGHVLLDKIFELKTLSEVDKNDTVNAMAAYYEDLGALNNRYLNEDLAPSQIRLNISQLEKDHGYVKWNSYFKGLFPKDSYELWIATNPMVVLNSGEYFVELENLHKRHEVLTRVNFAYTYFIYMLFTSYREQGETMKKAEGAHEDMCINMVTSYFGPAAAAVLLNATDAKNVDEWRYDIEILTEAVLSAFNFMVEGVDYIDREDKMRIINKVNSIHVETGIPDWLKNEADIASRTPQFNPDMSFLQNDMVAQNRLFIEQIQPLFGKKLLEDLSPDFRHQVDYNQFTINVHFGYIISPLYIYTDPLGLKFGGLGWAISKELLRAFDEVHVTQKPDDLEKWLKNETLSDFESKHECLFNLYAKYCKSESSNDYCNNAKTLKELALSGEALKIAYMAYRFTTQAIGREPPLPKLVKYTSDQIFMISAGQSFCTNYGKSGDVLSDVSPEEKIKITIQKSTIFSKIFKCPAKQNENADQCDTFSV